MKTFTFNKVGYTSGVYGCSNEYFNFILCNDGKMYGVVIYGMYGAEDRVRAYIEKLGFEYHYVPCNTYGKLTRKDIMRAYSEYKVTNGGIVEELLQNGFITDKK